MTERHRRGAGTQRGCGIFRVDAGTASADAPCRMVCGEERRDDTNPDSSGYRNTRHVLLRTMPGVGKVPYVILVQRVERGSQVPFHVQRMLGERPVELLVLAHVHEDAARVPGVVRIAHPTGPVLTSISP